MNLSILNQLFTKCWWWMLLWMFLAFLLGWLLRKLFNKPTNNCCYELENYKTKHFELENKYNELLNQKENPNTSKSLSNSIDKTNNFVDVQKKKDESLSVSNQKQKIITSPYSKLKDNNLQIIEGIGPKMEQILKKNNINTWSELAAKAGVDIRTVLDNENPTRYKIIDPTTWGEQAKLASEKKWESLIDYQKRLDTGKENAMGMTDSKLEKMMVKLGLLKKWKKNDLKAVEGIGPKIAKLLNDAHINTWKELSETSVDKLNQILEKAGKRFKLANPGTWPKQAKLADEDKWEELQAYQDELNGGV